MSAPGRKRGRSLRGWALGAAWAAAGCGGKEAADSGGGAAPPELAGDYNVMVTGSAGCEGRSELVTSWAQGPLRVSGPASALVLDFGQDLTFTGTVDGGGRLRWSGEAPTGTVFSSGILRIEDDRRVLDGTIELTTAEASPCTLEAPFLATEITAL